MHPAASALDRLAADGLEPGGAACVLRDGEVVVDHVVGTRDGVTPWTPDTLVMCYSVAKPFAALAVLTAVADGAFGLDQPVAEVWPAYGVLGKERTTVRQVLAHQAGQWRFPPTDLPFDDLTGLSDLLASSAPEHEPGTAVGEHASTYGHLCDALLRHATGEDLADRFAALARTHDWDVHLRVAPADLGRVADVVTMEPGWAESKLTDPRWGPALAPPSGLLDVEVLNSERFRTTSFPAIAVHASARGLARFYDDVLRPDGAVATMLGPDLHAAFTTGQATGHDVVLDREVTWTCGFQVDEEDLGMGGLGGCAGWVALADRTAVGFVTRGLGGHDRADDLWDALNPE